MAPITHGSNVSDSLVMFWWKREEKEAWLTDYLKEQLAVMDVQLEGETARDYNARVRVLIGLILREAQEKPLPKLDIIKPEDFMEYVAPLRNKKTLEFLSQSSYGNRRAAFNHIFRSHNGTGFPPIFQLRLAILYKGFYRHIAQQEGGGG